MSETDPVAARTVLVADIVGSTALYEELGDARAQQLITGCIDTLSEIATRNAGIVVATRGDEVLCAFADTADAAATACEMQLGVQEEMSDEALDGHALRLRIGCHRGELTVEPFDHVSEVVAIARHLAEAAKGDQILVSAETLAELPSIYRSMTRYVDTEPWRGTSTRQLELHELVWEVDGLTAHAPTSPPATTDGYTRVVLTLDDQHLIVDERLPVATVGRSRDNDLVIETDLASREHFRIALRHGRCTITDVSTNGTYIVPETGESWPVLRETLPLKGAGEIYAGQPGEENAPFAVHFRCE